MNKLCALALMVIAFVSCESSGSRRVSDSAVPAPGSFTPATTPLPGAGNGAAVASPAPATTTNSTAAVAVNPAHGAPGHRCEIPVGAPLNTPANNTPATVTNSNPAPVMLNPKPTVQPGNGNVRLNPAHGAPGHDCSIPVGQPLKN